MNYYEQQDPNAFNPITENPIILDFRPCRYCGEIHQILKQKFGLPEYYGENWDALWDCLRNRFYCEPQIVVEIHGLKSLPRDLQEYCQNMLEVFNDVNEETPNIEFRLIS